MSADLILEILIVAASAYAMFKAGSAYTIWRIQQDLIALENGELEFDENEDSTDTMSNAEFMNITKEEGMFFAHGHNSRFLTQGADLKELFTNIKNNYPGTTWLIGNGQNTLSQEEQDAIIPTLKSIFTTESQSSK
jgi:hypothetical protein